MWKFCVRFVQLFQEHNPGAKRDLLVPVTTLMTRYHPYTH